MTEADIQQDLECTLAQLYAHRNMQDATPGGAPRTVFERQVLQASTEAATHVQDRNAPCMCGSGKKAKKCCDAPVTRARC